MVLTGYEKVNYRLSQDIASKLYNESKENPTDRILSDFGACKLQIIAGVGTNVDHPIILIQESYNFNRPAPLYPGHLLAKDMARRNI